jgi:type II secretory pathway component PulK
MMEDRRGIVRLIVWMAVALAVLVAVLLIVGCTRSISTGVRDTCNDSKDNQYTCMLAQESGDGPDE